MTSLFKSPKAPAAPDPVATANAQSTANAEAARLQMKMNMVNQYTPYGSTTYTPIGDDRYRSDVSLTPLGQQAFDSEQRIDAATNRLAEDQLGRIGAAVSKPMDFSGLPSLTTDFSADRQRTTDAIIARNQPQMDHDRDRLANQLANQGLVPGSEAYNTAMDSLTRNQNDFRLAADQAGGQEQSRLYGLNADARSRGIAEMLQTRSQPINELAALLGTSQVAVPQPAAIPQVSVAGADVTGANTLSYNALMNRYNQQIGQQNAAMGGLFGVAGSALGGYLGRK